MYNQVCNGRTVVTCDVVKMEKADDSLVAPSYKLNCSSSRETWHFAVHPIRCVPCIRCGMCHKLSVQFALFVWPVRASQTGIW